MALDMSMYWAMIKATPSMTQLRFLKIFILAYFFSSIVVNVAFFQGLNEVTEWFKNKVEKPMLANGIVVTLRLVRVNNTLKKPGPVFNEMARAAYSAGASYFYRINDDTELLVNWPSIFTHALGLYSRSTPQ